MTLLQSDVSTSVIALWLGHEQEDTTRGYLHGDLRLKQRALDRTAPLWGSDAANASAAQILRIYMGVKF